MSVELDLSELDGDTMREFLNCRHNREVLALLHAEKEQEAVAAAYQADRKSVEGLGAPVLEVNATSFHFWGKKLGYEAWRDKGFVREFGRDNPAARVKAKGTKTQVGYQGNAEGGVQNANLREPEPPQGGTTYGGRFSKSYGARVGEAAMAR